MNRRSHIIGLAVGALVAAPLASADTGAVVEHGIPTTNSQPVSLAAGPDGALWFTELAGNQIGRITTDGSISEYPIPTARSAPDEITLGADGNLWFAETAGNKLGRITADGSVTEFGGLASGSQPTGVAAGPDGNVWFTERASARPTGKIGQITPAGVITEYADGITGHPLTIAAGLDGDLWFTESPGNKIGRFDPTTAQLVGEYAVPTPLSAPWEISAGPDGTVWFTERLGNKIGRITTDGTISEFAVPTAASMPNTIRPGPDPNPAKDCAYQRESLGEDAFAARYGDFGGCVSSLATTKTLWFSEASANRLAQITTDGAIFEFPLNGTDKAPGGLVEGPDRAVWFVELTGNAIGRLDVKSVGKPAGPGQRAETVAPPDVGAP